MNESDILFSLSAEFFISWPNGNLDGIKNHDTFKQRAKLITLTGKILFKTFYGIFFCNKDYWNRGMKGMTFLLVMVIELVCVNKSHQKNGQIFYLYCNYNACSKCVCRYKNLKKLSKIIYSVLRIINYW